MGDTEWFTNPLHVLAAPWHEFVRLWAACRGEMCIAHWPDSGAVGQQAAWVVDAFAALARASERLREANRGRGRE